MAFFAEYRSGLPTTITDDHTPAWGQAFPISVGNHSRDRNLSGMSCQQPPGSGPRMFSAGCTMNIGWKKLPREIPWRFCGVQLTRENSIAYLCGHPGMVEHCKEILRRHGYPNEALREEIYWVPERKAAA